MAATILLLASLLAAWIIHRARREYMEYRHLSSLTSVTASAVYALQTLLSALAAKKSWRPFTVGPAMRFGVGIPAVLVGLTFYAYGLISLRSPRPVAGLEANTLVTSGAYQWSRHPQLAGWGSLLLGLALIGRSGGPFGLTAFFWGASFTYLSVEERFLEKTSGDEYRRYRLTTPRFFGVAARSAQRFTIR